MSLVRPASELERPAGQIVRYAFGRGRPPMRATVAVAEAVRSAALSALHAMTGSKESFLLSGHGPNGIPDREHRHAYYLPQADETGALSEIMVVSPRDRFTEEEIHALGTVHAIQWNGPSTKLDLELIDHDDRSAIRLAARWVSRTPYVPPRRFWGTHGKRHLTPEKQLSTEFKETGAIVTEIRIETWDKIRVRVAQSARQVGRATPLCRSSFWVEFRVDRPICAPMAVGHSCHFGLGQFVPAGSDFEPHRG